MAQSLKKFYQDSDGNWFLDFYRGITKGSCVDLISEKGIHNIVKEDPPEKVYATGMYYEFCDGTGAAYTSEAAFLAATASFFVKATSGGGQSTDQYTQYVDPNNSLKIRTGVRNGTYIVDKEVTVTGFNGVENTDWENISGAL